ncbi:MAG: glycoside hydrolase family 130 protein [Puniceicoccaceae bacterium]
MSNLSQEFILKRNPRNPIISAKDIPNADAVFNCGQTEFNGQTLLLVSVGYRSPQDGRWSGLYVAKSDNGVDFEIEKEPFITTIDKAPYHDNYDWWTIDPRITKIDDTYYIVRPGQHPQGPTALLEKTKDFVEREFIDCIALPSNRVPCLFPEKVNGMYLRLDRPYNMGAGNEDGSIWISSSPDLIHWGRHHPVQMPYGFYFGTKIGPTPPIKTEKGWLVIIHGVHQSCNGSRYSLTALMLDLEDPRKVINRMNSWILTPDTDYELNGRVPNVVFTTGAIANPEKDEIRVYYGAADTCIGLATGSLSELIDACLKGV